MKRLAIVTTHPIQYNAPWFRLLAESGSTYPRVFYTWGQLEQEEKFDPGFGKKIEWDLPLLEGYEYCFVKNTAEKPGSHHRKGIINPTLITEIEQWKPDAVLVFGWNFISHDECIRWFHKKKIPILFRGDSTMMRKQNRIIALVRKLYLRRIYKNVDYALYTGVANRKYFIECGMNNSQLIPALHATDNNRFLTNEIANKEKALYWRRELGVKDDETVVLFAGKFESIKRPWLLLRLADMMKNKPVKFILVGNGPLETQLRQQAADNPQVIFIGFQNQQAMPVVYRMADYFILCSESETWGLSVNEAMACGCAVLISDTCGCWPDLVKEKINGHVFTDDNIESIAEKIIIEQSRKSELQAMKSASQKIIKEYSFEKIVDSVNQLMSKLQANG